MKKLTLLVALILVVTIGGVYATWTYAGGDVTSSHKHMSVNLASLGNTTPLGDITNVYNSMDVMLDDAGNYVAEANISGKMAFVFKPGAGAPDTVVNNGIELEFNVLQDTPYQYESKNVFNITKSDKTSLGNGEKITSTNATTLNPNVDLTSFIGGFYVEISAAQVAGYIEVNDITLPTRAAYDNMLAALAHGTLGVSVYEK